MANEELAQSLDRLHEQLTHGPQLDGATLQTLRSLLDEIQILCKHDATSGSASAVLTGQKAGEGERVHSGASLSINQRLQNVIEDFELRHPQLTSTLSQIADRLSDIGI